MKNPESIIEELSTREVRKLAKQCNLKNWETESIARLRRQLTDLATEQNIFIAAYGHAIDEE
jgi:hypothetical protein